MGVQADLPLQPAVTVEALVPGLVGVGREFSGDWSGGSVWLGRGGVEDPGVDFGIWQQKFQ